MYNIDQLNNFWILPIIKISEEKGYCTGRLSVNLANPATNMVHIFKNLFTQLTVKYDFVRYGLRIHKQRNHPYEIMVDADYPYGGWKYQSSGIIHFDANAIQQRRSFPFLFFEQYRLSKLNLDARLRVFDSAVIQQQITQHNDPIMDQLVAEFVDFATQHSNIWSFSSNVLAKMHLNIYRRETWTAEQFLQLIESADIFSSLLIKIAKTATSDAILARTPPSSDLITTGRI